MIGALEVARDSGAFEPEEQSHAMEAILAGKESGVVPRARAGDGSAVGADGGIGGGGAGDDGVGVDDSVVLSLSQVAELLLPAVRRSWTSLYRSVKDKTIGTAQLQRW